MSIIWTQDGTYRRIGYTSEADLESAIMQVQTELFGPDRIYLDIKKKIGVKGGTRNIPDGYLVDLSGKRPRLYVVETELAAHDPLRHIAVQILQFSISFQSEQRAVKSILFGAVQQNHQAMAQCAQYASEYGFRNLDHLLESMIYENPFAALVIIDDMPEYLEAVLLRSFQFGVEVLELARYHNSKGDKLYRFQPFLADVVADIQAARSDQQDDPAVDASEIDTIVVPARDDGFDEVFIGEDRWHAIRIHGTMRPQIKYIAAYRVKPTSAITHIAEVKSIEPWWDTGKFVVNFVAPAQPIGPIPLGAKAKGKAPQAPRYTSRKRLESAKTIQDIW